MDRFTADDVRNLIEESGNPAISLYMPTVRAGKETRENAIRYKNLLTEVEEQLTKQKIRRTDIDNLLERPRNLVSDTEYWQHQKLGFALFLTSATFHTFRIPLPVRELVTVADRFTVKPLLPVLTGDGVFSILALSRKSVRLLRATRFTVDEVPLEDMPTSLADALQLDTMERTLQMHTGTAASGSGGERRAMFHGHGSGGDDQLEKDRLLQYFQIVNKGLHPYLREGNAPLVLAGVEYLFPIYREANTYPHLVDGVVAGNPDEESESAIHEKAWKLVAEKFTESEREALSRFRELNAAGRASKNMAKVFSALRENRVDSLFVPIDEQRWGKYDAETNELELHKDRKPGDRDVFDIAAAMAIAQGGTVYAIERERMPTDRDIAAIFRY